MLQYFRKHSPRSPGALRRWRQHLLLGFSAENQLWFNRRWPYVRALAADHWTVFVSLAPLIGPVTLPPDFLHYGRWVIVSGEQGERRLIRNMDPAWARRVRDQCRAAASRYSLRR
jgi:protein gp37